MRWWYQNLRTYQPFAPLSDVRISSVVNGLLPHQPTCLDFKSRIILAGGAGLHEYALYDIEGFLNARDPFFASPSDDFGLPNGAGVCAWQALIPTPKLLRLTQRKGASAKRRRTCSVKFVNSRMALIVEESFGPKINPRAIIVKSNAAAAASPQSNCSLKMVDIEKNRAVLNTDMSGQIGALISKGVSESFLGLLGGIAVLDARSGDLTPHCYDTIHRSTITALEKIDLNTLVTGDNEGIIGVWDGRNLSRPLHAFDSFGSTPAIGIKKPFTHKGSYNNIRYEVRSDYAGLKRAQNCPIVSIAMTAAEVFVRGSRGLRCFKRKDQNSLYEAPWYRPLDQQAKNRQQLIDRRSVVFQFPYDRPLWATSTNCQSLQIIDLESLSVVHQIRASPNSHVFHSALMNCLFVADGISKPVSILTLR